MQFFHLRVIKSRIIDFVTGENPIEVATVCRKP
jgi:hypothetical protein